MLALAALGTAFSFAAFEATFLATLLLVSFLVFNLLQNTVAFLALPALAVLRFVFLAAHNVVELAVGKLVATFLLNFLLELFDVFHVFAFLLVLSAHLEVFQGLVELLVLLLGFVLFERLDLGLLLQQALLDIDHVLVGLQHFGQEIVWTCDRHLRLDQEPHSLHHIVACSVVERNFTLDLRLYLQVLRHCNGLLMGYSGD